MADVPKDEPLRSVLEELASSSGGALEFSVTTSLELGRSHGVELTRSPNAVYVFKFVDAMGNPQTAVAYTLTLAGDKRPATRAEALGRSIAASDGALFDLNPFLLVYDFAGQQLLAVSAIELFGAFADLAETSTIPYSGSSSFSLSPHFGHGTITMYADLRPPAVWATQASPGSLDFADLEKFLHRVASETASKRTVRSKIVGAIKSRVAATPAPSATIATPAIPSLPPGEYVAVEAVDESVRVDDRLWQMILRAIASSPSVILVGPPGTGKSSLLRKAIGAISEQRVTDGIPGVRQPLWATPDESWTARELIGGETIDDGAIVFRPGWVLRAIAEDRWLILDEANRGDLDRIFGALLTWLGGGAVTVGVESAADDARSVELGWTDGPSRVESVAADGAAPAQLRYLASVDEWKLLGTYNALDAQRVFRIGAALGRRFVRVPIPPLAPPAFRRVLADQAVGVDPVFIDRIGTLYAVHFQFEVTRLGPALFLGMCNYLRVASSTRPTTPVDRGGESAENVASGNSPATAPRSSAVEASGPRVDVMHEQQASIELDSSAGSLRTVETGESTTPDFYDVALSEAYLLHLGTSLAQLEEPDLDQLAHRIREEKAITPDGVAWVTEMIRALA